MNSKSRIIDLLTVCRKAGKLTLGFDAVCADVRSGRAVLVLHTADASLKTVKELHFLSKNTGGGISVLSAPMTRLDSASCFRKGFTVLAVCDPGFAKKITLLCGDDIPAIP